MNRSKLFAGSIALATSLCALPTHAVVNGWFDRLNINMVDNVYGWICDESSPYSPPAGTLAIYTGGPAGGGGTYYYDASLQPPNWGGSRPDVPAAGFCGGNANVAWTAVGWFAQPIYIYYRHPGGSLQLIGGSGYKNNCPNGIPGDCY